MNKKYALLLVIMSLSARPALADNPHEISNRSPSVDCLGCHLNPPPPGPDGTINSKNHRIDPAAYKTDGIEMCSGCHDKDDGHKVGLKLDFDVPADMPLDKKNKLTCLTCHYTHGSLTSNRPQASYSFMDRLVDAERLHKSFLLRRNNAEGELCLTCHEVKKGTNND